MVSLTLALPPRFSPIFLIRESNVVGFTPRSSAAPSAPLIFQPVFSSTTSRLSRSSRSISGSVSYSKIMVEEGGELAGTIEKIADPKVVSLKPAAE